MDREQLSIEKVTQLLHQHTFPASVEAALIAVRECDMFSSSDLSTLSNRFVFCHTQSPSATNASQLVWIKTLNNLQELHTLDMLRQFLENQSDMRVSTRVFNIIFVDVLADARHPLFTLYYSLMLKFLSLVLSFESKQTLTIIARWFLTLSPANDSLAVKIIEHILYDHIALAMSNSIKHLCLISPVFTLCFMTQTAMLLDKDNLDMDVKNLQILIELVTYGLTNATSLLLVTLHEEFTAKSNPLLFNFVPPLIRLNVLCPLRSFESASLRLHLDHFHTSILSFLFSLVIPHAQRDDHRPVLTASLLPPNYFEHLSVTIQDAIGREGPDKASIDECIQRYLQIVSVCKMSALSLTQLRIRELGKSIPLFTRHKLFDVLKHKEQQETRKK